MMNNICYDSFDIRYKKPFGAVATGEEVTFSVSTVKNVVPKEICLHIYKADELYSETIVTMKLNCSDNIHNFYSCKFKADNPQLYFYYFSYIINEKEYTLSKSDSTPHWQLTVYDNKMTAPNCLNGIMYHIFPDRFKNSGTTKENVPTDRFIHENWLDIPHYLPNEQGKITNTDYFGGDLKGISEQLPYLKSLGVGTIYLNPIFEAHSSHRYNTADYMKVDPLLGTDEDFKELCSNAKNLGISIVLDGVFSHTGDDSIYFNKQKRYGDSGAYNDTKSPYRKWYKWKLGGNYVSWWGFDTLPEVDESNSSYREFICGENGVLEKWLSLGARGYRLDVADELPDNFLKNIHRTVKTFDKDNVIIGEVWEDASNKISYGVRRKYLLGSQLDTVMNYPFKDAILSYIRYGDYKYFMETVLTILENYPRPVINSLMNSLSTHDTERAITRLVGEDCVNDRQWQRDRHFLNEGAYAHGKRLLKLASIIQYTISGIPCLYYGDEVGVSGYKDPFNRTCYPYGHEDIELLEHFKVLGKLRIDNPILKTADFIPLSYNENILSYMRVSENTTKPQKLFIAINRDYNEHIVPIPEEFLEHEECIFGDNLENGILKPYSAVIYRI